MPAPSRTLGIAAALMLTGAMLAGSMTAAAQTAPRKQELRFDARKAERVERASPCQAHGPGFKPGPGGSCIRVFGGVITEVGTRRNLR